MVVQRTYKGIKQNKNHSKIPSTFRDIEFLLEKFEPKHLYKIEENLLVTFIKKIVIPCITHSILVDIK